MRICSKCLLEKPDESFELLHKGKTWRRRECKSCVKLRCREYAEKSKRLIREYVSQDGAEKAKKAIERASQWNKKHPERHRKSALAYYYRMQHKAIMAYGGYKCACCGETEPLFLGLDHIENNGKEHRESIGNWGGHGLYKWLERNNYPKGFQVLCMNCNHGKQRNGGICPHKGKSNDHPERE